MRPQFELTGYRGVEVRQPPTEVTDAEVDATLEEIRKSRAKLVAEEGRVADKGDVVLLDVAGKPADGDAEPFAHEGVMIELGDPKNLPAFDEHLQGVTAGDERSFDVDYPEDYQGKEMAGKSVHYTLQVKEVKRKELPELDDELAKDMGDFDDLAGLRAQIESDMRQHKEREATYTLRQAVLDKVLVVNPVVLPDSLVESQIRHRLEQAVGRLIQQGVDPRKMDLDWEELRKAQEEPARKSVHARLVLDAVARVEELEVSDAELESQIRQDAASTGESYAQLRKKIEEHSGVEVVRNQLLREKSLDLLVSIANIQS